MGAVSSEFSLSTLVAGRFKKKKKKWITDVKDLIMPIRIQLGVVLVPNQIASNRIISLTRVHFFVWQKHKTHFSVLRSLTWLWEWTFQSFPSTHQLIYHYEDHNCTCFELCDEMDELIFSLSLWHRQPTRSTTTERCSILVFYARLWMPTEVCVRVCVGFGNESGIDASTSWRRRKFSYQWKKVEKISLPANPIISTTHHRILIEKH